MKTKMLGIAGIAFLMMWFSTSMAKTFPEQTSSQCDFFQSNRIPDFSGTPCESGNGLDESGNCNTTEKCSLGSHCYVAWRNTPEVIVEAAGCWVRSTRYYCNSSDCRAKNGSSQHGVYFCCCRGDYCTRGFHIVPETPSTEQPQGLPDQERRPDMDESFQELLLNFSRSTDNQTRFDLAVFLKWCSLAKAKMLPRETMEEDALEPQQTYHQCDYFRSLSHFNSGVSGTPCESGNELDENGNCNTTQKCPLDSHCYIIWENNPEKIITSGCWPSTDIVCEHGSDCQAKNGSGQQGVYSCCCRGDYCTRGFHIVPETPSTEEPEETSHGVISLSLFLGIYIPALIILVACVTVGYYFWRKRKRGNPEMDRDRGAVFINEEKCDEKKQDSFTCQDGDHDSGAFSTEDDQVTEPIFLSRVLTVD